MNKYLQPSTKNKMIRARDLKVGDVILLRRGTAPFYKFEPKTVKAIHFLNDNKTGYMDVGVAGQALSLFVNDSVIIKDTTTHSGTL